MSIRQGNNIIAGSLDPHRVIEFQAPTAENNYTWYRKYADGWVEQGGTNTITQTTITLPVPMANATYSGQITCDQGGSFFYAFVTKTTTSITIRSRNTANVEEQSSAMWEVKGMAAS